MRSRQAGGSGGPGSPGSPGGFWGVRGGIATVLALIALAGCESGAPRGGGEEGDRAATEPAGALGATPSPSAAGASPGGEATRGEADADVAIGPADASAVTGDGPAAGSAAGPSADSSIDTVEPGSASASNASVAAAAPVAVPESPSGSRPRFVRPDSIRGVYLNAWTAGSSRRLAQLLALADTTEINTFVIDIKDATGYVSHRSALPAVAAAGATGEIRITDLGALLRNLEQHGIYPIARIVVVKDPKLIAHQPELAVQDTAGGVWVDSKGFVWLNPWDRRTLDYHLDLAREVVEFGFPEIQWDYIRFPDAPQSDLQRAEFPGQAGVRANAIRRFLEQARSSLDSLGARSTADVFGVTTTFRRDVGIGQVWESFIDVVDAALPMVYPSHYWTGSFGIDDPNAHPYEIVFEAMNDAVARSASITGAGEVVPWLQDFSLGEPRYGAVEVRSQIQAVYDAGLEDWVLWNPGSRYTAAALRPDSGWSEPPLLRIGNERVALEAREDALQRTRRLRFVTDSLERVLEVDAADAVENAPTAPPPTPPTDTTSVPARLSPPPAD